MIESKVLEFECRCCHKVTHIEHGGDAFFPTERCNNCHSLAFGLINRRLIPREDATGTIYSDALDIKD